MAGLGYNVHGNGGRTDVSHTHSPKAPWTSGPGAHLNTQGSGWAELQLSGDETGATTEEEGVLSFRHLATTSQKGILHNIKICFVFNFLNRPICFERTEQIVI